MKDKKYRGEDNLTLSELDEMSMRPEKPLRVKIIQQSEEGNKYILGTIFVGISETKTSYYCRYGENKNNYFVVNKKDCEIIKEEEQKDKMIDDNEHYYRTIKIGINKNIEKIKFESIEDEKGFLPVQESKE